MLKITMQAIAISIATAAIAQDQPRENEKRALNELSGEMLECSTYFLISAQCIESHPDPSAPRTANDLRQAAEKIGTLAIATGRSIGVTDEAVEARTKLEFQKLMKSINNNCVNIAVLLDRYNNLCRQLSQEPDKRIKELLATADEQDTCFKMSGDVAIAACNGAIMSGGHDLARLYSKRGFEYDKKREYDRAIKDFDEAIKLDPYVPLFFNHRGSAFLKRMTTSAPSRSLTKRYGSIQAKRSPSIFAARRITTRRSTTAQLLIMTRRYGLIPTTRTRSIAAATRS
jgi:tetratricopeptide (TPR) repeat protein